MAALRNEMADRWAGQSAREPDDGMASVGGQLLVGTVKVFLNEREAGVEIERGEIIDSCQAASCLLAPMIGDRVLLYVEGSDSHILSILERRPGHAAELSVPDATRIAIRSTEGLELNAPKVRIVAREMNIVARAFSQTGEILSSNFRRVMETVVDKTIGARTITTKAEARTAVVSEVDTVSAGMLVQNIDKVATQSSEISLIVAKQDVRLDATRVSVG